MSPLREVDISRFIGKGTGIKFAVEKLWEGLEEEIIQENSDFEQNESEKVNLSSSITGDGKKATQRYN